jgi:hypothetical protein
VELALRQGRMLTPRRFTALLTSVLFLTGIAGKFDPSNAKAALLVFAVVVLASVAFLVVTTPVART